MIDKRKPIEITIREGDRQVTVRAVIVSELGDHTYTVQLQEPITVGGNLIEYFSIVDDAVLLDETHWNSWS